VKRPRKLATDRARRFCAALGDLSERRPQRWRMLHSVAQRLGVGWDEAEAAANEAAEKGWLTIEGGHSVCLTEDGRRVGAKRS
jgi:Mn-dependent DtxR family transcriptional regulator